MKKRVALETDFYLESLFINQEEFEKLHVLSISEPLFPNPEAPERLHFSPIPDTASQTQERSQNLGQLEENSPQKDVPFLKKTAHNKIEEKHRKKKKRYLSELASLLDHFTQASSPPKTIVNGKETNTSILERACSVIDILLETSPDSQKNEDSSSKKLARKHVSSHYEEKTDSKQKKQKRTHKDIEKEHRKKLNSSFQTLQAKLSLLEKGCKKLTIPSPIERNRKETKLSILNRTIQALTLLQR